MMLGVGLIVLFIVVVALVGGFESGAISSWLFVLLELITMSIMTALGARFNRKMREQDRKAAERWTRKRNVRRF